MSTNTKICPICNRIITICYNHKYCKIQCKVDRKPLYLCFMINDINPYNVNIDKTFINDFRSQHENQSKCKQE